MIKNLDHHSLYLSVSQLHFPSLLPQVTMTMRSWVGIWDFKRLNQRILLRWTNVIGWNLTLFTFGKLLEGTIWIKQEILRETQECKCENSLYYFQFSMKKSIFKGVGDRWDCIVGIAHKKPRQWGKNVFQGHKNDVTLLIDAKDSCGTSVMGHSTWLRNIPGSS